MAAAQGYYLYVGTSPGATDVVNTGALPASSTSYTVNDLPYEQTLYATIWTELAGDWLPGSNSTFTTAPQIAVLTSPASGATNVPVNGTIRWSSVPDAQAYRLTLGTKSGASDLLDTGVFQGVSQVVNNLPAEQTLYATLRTQVSGVWYLRASIFTTGPAVAILTFPANGATGVAYPCTFQWTGVTGAQAYYLWVGTSPGARDVVNTGELPAGSTSYTVNDLPYEQTLYATIWTELAGDWLPGSSSTFTTAPQIAVLTSPASGATKVPVNGTIQWSGVANAQAYRLTLGTRSGGSDVLDTGAFQGVSQAVKNLPAQQTLYATIWTELAGVWWRNQSSFTTGPAIAILTSPVDGATGVAYPCTFQWTGVTGAQAYYLWVGTSPGARDVVNTGERPAGSTSYTVNDLPYEQTLYATVWTEVAETWWPGSSITFTTAPRIAVLTTFANGATNVPVNGTIRWTSVPDAQAHRLTLGTKSGASDVLDTGAFRGVSHAVNNLPAQQTLYATIWTELAGVWWQSQSSFTTAPVIATLISPANGAAGVASACTFQWTGVTGAQAYYLWVGTSPGARDVVETGGLPASSTSYTVNNLPYEQTLYATIWTKLAGAWSQSSSSTFTTAPEFARNHNGFNRYASSPLLLFTSWEFVCLFLPVVLLVQRLLRFGRGALGFLVLASFFWYSVWDWRFCPLILISIAGNWWGCLVLEKRRRRWLLAALVLFNLLPLFYFKYIKFAFLAVGLHADDWILPALIPQILPLGISFYTFRNLAYVIDVYNGDKAEHSWVHFGFFVLFFPQLLAGPITHHAQFLPQVGVEPPDRKSMFLQGCIYFLVGFVKKRFMADILAGLIDPYYQAGHVQFADQAIVAALGYGLQLYFDFSGYSDMAVGLGAMLGFRLPWNFNSPYKARSFTEFWTRWHITLYAFLRDYIFVPLEVATRGNPIPILRTSANLLLTMLLCGLWHGAGWAFIVWGAGHSMLMCVQNAVGDARWRKIPSWLRSAGVFICVTLLWIPFRAESLSLSGEILHGLVFWRQVAWRPEFTYCAAGLLLILFAPNSHAITAWCAERLRSSADAIWALGGRLGWYSMFSVLTAATIIMFFYRAAPDPWLRAHLPLGAEREYVRSDVGDLRTNIDKLAALHGTNPKWVIAGPSYATALGLFSWTDGKESVTVGSIGVNGSRIESWVRIPGALLRDPFVRRIYISCEPVGMSPPTPPCPLFRGEGTDVLAELGIKTPPRRLGSLGPETLNPAETIWDIVTLQLKSSKYFQLQAMSLAVCNGICVRDPSLSPTPLDRQDLLLAYQAVESLWRQAKAFPRPPGDLTTASEAVFLWNNRGIVEGLAEGGETDRVLGKLIDLARSRGIEIIFYESPTLKYRPEIYPPGFFDRYQAAVIRFTKRHKVRYIDLSGLLPEDGNAFYDFSHARVEVRNCILKVLIERTDHVPLP